ncbi:hypothetical protein ACCO45_000571 [Purpureocillium lilacinum]|uniref:Uncharacterized protein n=1 Tax=Purpureocillium lilacinum TaxID=33203 RepID=A0ACC4E5P8_PURLI
MSYTLHVVLCKCNVRLELAGRAGGGRTGAVSATSTQQGTPDWKKSTGNVETRRSAVKLHGAAQGKTAGDQSEMGTQKRAEWVRVGGGGMFQGQEM